MRNWLIRAAAALPILVLGWMAGEREWVLRTGRSVWLRTAPIDPRDVFRGDYVRLDYEISHPPQELWRGGLKVEAKPDSPVYAVLEPDDGGIAQLLFATDRKPAEGLFILGRIDRSYSWEGLQARYGLEALFVEQGRGLELEEGRTRQGIQVPLEIEAAVSSSGLAVIRSHRWSPLGLGLELEPLPPLPGPLPPGSFPQENAGQPRPYRLALKLLNASERPLAIILLPGHGSFVLKPIRGTGSRWQPVRASEKRPAPADEHVQVLGPGEIQEVHLDLSEPLWKLKSPQGTSGALGQGAFNWSDWFRLEYQPPARADCSHLKEAARIWHGRLPSRAFNGQRNRD